MLSVFTQPDVNTRKVGRTRDKRRKPRREAEWFPVYRYGNHFTFLQYLMLKHTISITCCLEVAVIAFFLYYQAKKKARSRLKTRQKNLKGFIELFVGNLWLMFLNFETTRCQFHKKLCAWRKVIRQILLIISWLFKQKLTLPLYQQHQNLFVIDLSPKSLFWTSKQPFAKSSWKPLRFASWFLTLISCSPNLPRVYIRLYCERLFSVN